MALASLESFIYPTQGVLFKRLRKKYRGSVLYCDRSFILVKGEAPIMLIAHLDTVHNSPVKDICKSYGGNILMSPQGIGGDDRCGVYALATAYDLADKKPWLLFTCDEEIGGLGARVFCKAYKRGKLPARLRGLKFLVEVDRRGSKDAVYYDCANPDFEKYIASKGYETALGSYSDISDIAPALGVAAVNLSSGYYNAHTLHEYINRSELENTIEKVCEMVADAALADFPRFPYVDNLFGYLADYDLYYDPWFTK